MNGPASQLVLLQMKELFGDGKGLRIELDVSEDSVEVEKFSESSVSVSSSAAVSWSFSGRCCICFSLFINLSKLSFLSLGLCSFKVFCLNLYFKMQHLFYP